MFKLSRGFTAYFKSYFFFLCLHRYTVTLVSKKKNIWLVVLKNVCLCGPKSQREAKTQSKIYAYKNISSLCIREEKKKWNTA